MLIDQMGLIYSVLLMQWYRLFIPIARIIPMIDSMQRCAQFSHTGDVV